MGVYDGLDIWVLFIDGVVKMLFVGRVEFWMFEFVIMVSFDYIVWC